MPDIQLNGETRQIAAGSTIASLVVELKLERGAVAVELNKQIVPRARHGETTLNDGDQVEVVSVVGGG